MDFSKSTVGLFSHSFPALGIFPNQWLGFVLKGPLGFGKLTVGFSFKEPQWFCQITMGFFKSTLLKIYQVHGWALGLSDLGVFPNDPQKFFQILGWFFQRTPRFFQIDGWVIPSYTPGFFPPKRAPWVFPNQWLRNSRWVFFQKTPLGFQQINGLWTIPCSGMGFFSNDLPRLLPNHQSGFSKEPFFQMGSFKVTVWVFPKGPFQRTQLLFFPMKQT